MNILFLGDSITDCGHCFTSDNLGNGYVKKLSLLPGIYATNGGTDGFTFPDVLRKWRLMDARKSYDCVVIACGINDAGVITDLEEAGRHEAAAAFLEGSMAALRTLLDELSGTAGAQAASQLSQILLLEPFLFPIPQARILWLPILQEVRERIQEAIASAPCARYIPTQAALNNLVGQIGLSAVTTDGIHLTDKGHECLTKLVADALEIFCNQ